MQKFIFYYVCIHLIGLIGTALMGMRIAYEWAPPLELVFAPLAYLGIIMLLAAPAVVVIVVIYKFSKENNFNIAYFLCAEIAICLCQLFSLTLACQ
jgi:hypothetical protein